MAEEPQALSDIKEAPSRNLSFGSFLKESFKDIVLFAAIGYVAGLGAEKAGIGKLFSRKKGPLATGNTIHLDNMMAESREQNQAMLKKFGVSMYGLIGAKIGIIGGIFKHWRKEKAKEIGVEKLYENLEPLDRKLAVDDATLQEDNRFLKKRVEFLQKQNQDFRTRVSTPAATPGGPAV